MLYSDQVTVFDGGFGSELERRGLAGTPEDLNITHPDDITDIHKSYACADIITTNTFGLNRLKYHGEYNISEVARAAIKNARSAGKKVFFDVGPTGVMMEPIGTLTFERAYETYAEIARLTSDSVDGYIAETFSDIYELKACVLALKENSDKPVFATVTFDRTERTLTGSTPEIVATVLEGLGADALGVNCSLGPGELLPIVARLLNSTSLPVIVQPNRGLPTIENGKTVYQLGIDEFVENIEKMLDMGVAIIGGCCGTTPEFIKRLSVYSKQAVAPRKYSPVTAVCSAEVMTVFDGVKICGERLNPTGKKALKEALINGDYDYLIDEAVKQQDAGADLLDLNAGLPQIDEKSVMPKAIKSIQEYCGLPIQIDSSDPKAIEAGARVYNGIPLINSVNGEEEVMAKIFPIAKKYGAVVLGLTMDSNGVPKTAAERVKIAEKIISRAESFGIPRHKIMIDTLVVTASAEQERVAVTLKALKEVSEMGIKTALGVSNVSFGLPNRPLLNRTFLSMAMAMGLNMPILNPLDPEMTGAVRAFSVLMGIDKNSERYIDIYKDWQPSAPAAAASANISVKSADTLYDCVKSGLKNRAEELAEEELKTREPMEVIDKILIKALSDVGEMFERGKLFLPQLVQSAEAAKAAFAAVGRRLPKDAPKKARVILATVKGDVHDIGKNIVKVVLESYGYQVTDLGKDVPPEKVLEAYLKLKPAVIGLSALMTTTVRGMEETVKLLKASGCEAKIFVGGAVLNEETAAMIGADYYTRDALEMAKKLEEIL